MELLPPVQDPASAFVELQNVPLSPSLQAVKILLHGSRALWGIGHSSPFYYLAKTINMNPFNTFFFFFPKGIQYKIHKKFSVLIITLIEIIGVSFRSIIIKVNNCKM